MFTIDQEAKKNKLIPLSLDYMGPSYKNIKGDVTFPSPLYWLLEKNLFFLAANSTKKKFNLKYIMRPDYLSFDEYNTVVLAPLLMYVNGVFCIEEFNLNTIIVPKLSFISEILVDKFPELSPNNLEAVNW
jgi:hypothetical protein